MKCLFVYNDISGGSKESKYHDLIIKSLKEVYEQVDLFCATKDFDFDNVLTSNNYDDVICAGGDGSISILINKLIQNGNKWNIGYIPLGTANDYALNLSIPKNIKESLSIIKQRKVENEFIGKVNDKCLLYALALGKVSSVSYKANIKTKKFLYKFSYILEGVKELFSFKKQNITLKFDNHGIQYRTPLILILNTHTLGGFKVNHSKRNAYDVIILKPGLLNGLFGLICIFLFGYKKTNTIHYDYFNLDKFSVETNESVSWCLDGEEYKTSKVDIEAKKENIRIYKK